MQYARKENPSKIINTFAKSENPNADIIAYVSQYSLDDAVNSKQVAIITHIQNGQAVAVDGTEYTYFIPVISVVK